MNASKPTYLTLQEAATLIGCHYQTVYRHVRSGELPALIAGGSYRIERTELEVWLAGGDTQQGAVPTRRVRDWRQQCENFSTSLKTGDSSNARQQVDRLLAGGATVDELCDYLIGPAMSEIGSLWASGLYSIADEHRAARIVESLLERVGDRTTRTGPRIGVAIVAAASGDDHALPAQMIATSLRSTGFVVHYLGASMPADEIIAMAISERADVVLLSSSMGDHVGLQAAIVGCVAEGIPVIVGGNGVTCQAALGMGATAYACTVAEAQQLVRGLASSATNGS